MKVLYVETLQTSDIKSFQSNKVHYKQKINVNYRSTSKSLENIIDDYPNVKFGVFHNYKTLDDFINYQEDKNIVLECDEIPFILSFLKDQTLNELISDFKVFQTELNYGVNFGSLFNYISELKDQVKSIIQEKPNIIIFKLYGKNIFFSLLLSYLIKQNRKDIKIIITDNKPCPYKNIFEFIYEECIEKNIIDNMFWGYNEHIIIDICEDKELKRIGENFNYTHRIWENNALKISKFEIENNFFMSAHNIECPYDCSFCLSPKKHHLDFEGNKDTLDEMIDYLIWVYQKYDINVVRLFYPLPFTNDEFKYFFEKLLEKQQQHIKISLYSTGFQLIDNIDILNEFEELSVFPGVEHFSDRILKLMNKQTTREMNQKILLNNFSFKVYFFLLYNFMNESIDEFKDLLFHLNVFNKSNKPNTHPELIKMFFSSTETTYKYNEGLYDITYIEPIKLKEHFKISNRILFFNYINNQYPYILQEKNKLLMNLIG